MEKTMSCRNNCIEHKAIRPSNQSRYGTGQKRCQICDIFIHWNGLFCPCCGMRLRMKPRNKKYKTKLLEEKMRY